MAVGKDNRIVIAEKYSTKVYVCQNIDEESELKLICKFESDCDVGHICISDKNEIVVSPYTPPVVHIYTMEGKLVKKFELPEEHTVLSLAFNYVTNEILTYTNIVFEDTHFYTDFLDEYYFSRYTKSGEQIETADVTSPFGEFANIKSHPSGPVLLVNESYETKVLRLQ